MLIFYAETICPSINATTQDLDPLMERIGDARIVMLGEASHGTHEYYTWRSRISKRLIHEKGFKFIAVEGDWPDCYRINRYIKHYEPAIRKSDRCSKAIYTLANLDVGQLGDRCAIRVAASTQ